MDGYLANRYRAMFRDDPVSAWTGVITASVVILCMLLERLF